MCASSVASFYRTHSCTELRLSDTGKTVRISGWLHSIRDHGELRFLDLRDHYGTIQCVVEISSKAYSATETLSLESVITVDGKVIARDDETRNTELATGDIEIQAEQISCIGMAEQLPFSVNKPISDHGDYPEELRFRHRYLDLRRSQVKSRIALRSEVIHTLRMLMADAGFPEIQTPLLTAASPEGARDFIVPSRLHPGKFYALPQAPQMFKQMLMISGFDRYFQIAPCFRDEDARADRSPGEFYQLDLEMAFVTQENVLQTVEAIIGELYRRFAGSRSVTSTPFPRIPYRDAMERYGSDKPDLRNPLIIQDLSHELAGTQLRIFSQILAKQGQIRAIRAPDSSGKPRAWFDNLNKWAREEGQPGLGYITWKDNTAEGPLARHLSEDDINAIISKVGIRDGDSLFFIANLPEDHVKATAFAAATRDRLGQELECIDKNRFDFCWIVDFPMFERDPNTGIVDFSHNPFSMPQGGADALKSQDPASILAWQYDIVCNGIELSSGAIRNHEPETLLSAFAIAGYERANAEDHFSGLLRALRYGAPPHGGSAPGIDRIVMMLADCKTIREIVAFPFTQTAQDLLMGAPAKIDAARLKEFTSHLRAASKT